MKSNSAAIWYFESCKRLLPRWRVALQRAFATLIVMMFATGTLADKGDGILEPGESREAELARAAQNPIASLISLPLQNNTSFDFGPREKTHNVLNVQPLNMQFQAFYNVEKPDDIGPEWSTRLQLQFLFPK